MSVSFSIHGLTDCAVIVIITSQLIDGGRSSASSRASTAMSSPLRVPDAETNGVMEDEDVGKRDVKNHMLFEVSTEAANRGRDRPEVLSVERR